MKLSHLIFCLIFAANAIGCYSTGYIERASDGSSRLFWTNGFVQEKSIGSVDYERGKGLKIQGYRSDTTEMMGLLQGLLQIYGQGHLPPRHSPSTQPAE